MIKQDEVILIPNVTDEQQRLAQEWWLNHSCLKDSSLWEEESDIKTDKRPIIKIIHNSVSHNIYLYCPICNEKYDATDYGSW